MAAPAPHQVLAANQRAGRQLAEQAGIKRTRAILKAAQQDLEKRLRAAQGLAGEGGETFSIAQMRTTLAQVREVSRQVEGGMQRTLLDVGARASEHAAGQTLKYLEDANRAFAGLGEQPLALREAAIVDQAASGVRSTILRRLATSGEKMPGADAAPHKAKLGILERYGRQTIGHFEEVLQRGLLTRKPWADVREELTAKSSFLKDAPAHWAERIVRTETMGIQNRAHWETIRAADDALGDMAKILAATFDDRTAADSYAVHGQIRRPEEAFETWYGAMQHPPARPNDRETVVPHRIAWPIPPYLAWRSAGEIAARWRREGRKGAPPGRPTMTTIPIDKFGRAEERPREEEKKQEQRQEPIRPRQK